MKVALQKGGIISEIHEQKFEQLSYDVKYTFLDQKQWNTQSSINHLQIATSVTVSIFYPNGFC